MEDGIGIADGAVPGPHGPVPVRRYAPAAPHAPRLLWVHGGAFVSGGLDQRESHEVAVALAARGVPVTTVDYRRASSRLSRLLRLERGADVRYPVPADDVLAVARHERLHAPVVVGGASAGAALAASAALSLDEEGIGAEAAVLVYGILHAVLPPATAELRARVRRRGARFALHTATGVALMNRHYAGGLQTDPRAFPGGHPLGRFPPCLVLDADRDALRASGTAFAAELAAAGRPVRHHVEPGTAHAFLDRPRDPGFIPAVDRIAGWLRAF